MNKYGVLDDEDQDKVASQERPRRQRMEDDEDLRRNRPAVARAARRVDERVRQQGV